MKYLDTSIVIGNILKDEPMHQQCFDIVQALSNSRERALFSILNIAEVFYILQREKFTLGRIRQILEDFKKVSNVEFTEVSIDDCMSALRIAEKYEIDLTDAIMYLLMKKYKLKYIYSLDDHLDKFKEIKRLTQLKS